MLYREGKRGPLFLLIRNAKGHWDFPKGGIERGESVEEALRRETAEETGIRSLRLAPGFRRKLSWRYTEGGRRFFKTAHFCLARTGSSRVRLSREHTGARWLLPGKAARLLRFPGPRRLLREAVRFLAGGGKG